MALAFAHAIGVGTIASARGKRRPVLTAGEGDGDGRVEAGRNEEVHSDDDAGEGEDACDSEGAIMAVSELAGGGGG